MKQTGESRPVSLRRIKIEDPFWKQEMELVRKEVIPYQWETLNDRVPEASPSYCMHNFRVAGKMMREKRELGDSYEEPKYTFRGFEALPEDPEHLEDKFYGYVFQDSDFYKWIEAVAYSLTQHPDEQLQAIADEAIDVVCAAQHESGYMDTYYIINGMDKIFTNLKDNHELYCFGHLTEAAVAYYQATGKDALLNAAKRYADFIMSRFGEEEGKLKGYPGHEIAEMALARLYEATGEEKYLKLAAFFLNERGTQPYYFDSENHPGLEREKRRSKIRYTYHQAHIPVREQKEAVGHAVRAVYLYSGMADVARLTGDESLKAACDNLWENITRKQMYVTGSIGQTAEGEAFTFDYDLPNDTVYAETCAAIGLVFFARRMLQMKPDSRYSDVMERALHNGVLSGMALDGKSFFYVNPLSVHPESDKRDPRKGHVKPVRQKWFGCACCPPNIARLLSSIGSYAFTENDDTLFVHLYAGGTVEKEIDGRTVGIVLESGLPWRGNASVSVRTGEPVRMTIALRIPGWCGGRYTLAGAEGKSASVKDGYLYLTGEWTGKEKIRLSFDMSVRLLVADSRVRKDEGLAAFTRGPIVYCAEEADNGKDIPGLRIDPASAVTEEESSRFGVPAILLSADGYYRKPVRTDELYTDYVRPVYEPRTLHFIPYYMWANRGEGEMDVWLGVKE